MSVNNFNSILYTIIDVAARYINLLTQITIGPLSLLGWIVGFAGLGVVITTLYGLFGFRGYMSVRN